MKSAAAARRPIFARPGVLEALVGLSILVALSGVVMPASAKASAPRAAAARRATCSSSRGPRALRARHAHAAHRRRGPHQHHLALRPGHIPAEQPFGASADARPIEDALLNASMGRTRWHGPYMAAELHPDPWGNAYLVNADGWITPGEQAMVLSAGPDGVVQTAPGPGARAATTCCWSWTDGLPPRRPARILGRDLRRSPCAARCCCPSCC
jgi:hypothetical protein